MTEKNLKLKRIMLALCLVAACWIPVRAEVLPGDIDGNGKTDINDLTVLIDYLLTRDASSVDLQAADVNSDGRVDICDVTALIDVILQTEVPQDDQEWVDLALPSGTLWATCNVGASSPEEYGDYFAWGETETTPKDNYDWNTYKWTNGNSSRLTKYCTYSSYGTVDNKTVLDLEDDAAYVNWGPSWRMPSLEQIQELVDNCSSSWTTLNGVNGCLVTGPNGNTLFLPAAGSRYGSTLGLTGTNGFYWSLSCNSRRPIEAYCLSINSGGWEWRCDARTYGCSVRAVRVPQN